MNETILELILTAVMGFFMVFDLVGCRRARAEEAAAKVKNLGTEPGAIDGADSAADL